jgi:hypothetical protein
MRSAWMLALLLLGCSQAAEKDLPSIVEARSLGAEWALVNEQAAQKHLTTAYVETMHQQLRDELEASRDSLARPKSVYGHEIDLILNQPDDASPQQLRVHVARLKQIEDKLESA